MLKNFGRSGEVCGNQTHESNTYPANRVVSLLVFRNLPVQKR
jgi:hypothetical protein